MWIIKCLQKTVSIVKPKNVTKYSILRKYNDVSFENIPEVSSALIKKTLKIHNVNNEEGYTCFITPCIVCKEPEKNKQCDVANKMYINKTTGMFMCTLCMRTGQWDLLEATLNLKKEKKTKRKDTTVIEESGNAAIELKESLENIRNTTREIKFLTDEELTSVLDKFKLPKSIQRSNLDHLDIRLNQPNNLLHFPLENADSSIVGYRTLQATTKEDNVLPHIQCGGLLTSRAPKNKTTALLVPNISDFLILVNSKISLNVVCLPNGDRSLSQFFLPSLERFSKLILWLGSDSASWDAARHFGKKLGEKRCSLIRPNELLPHLKENQDFKAIISNAQAMHHKSITTFSSLRAEVLSDLQNIDKVQGVKLKRFPTLNKIIKGHRRGELTIFTGPTGSGKTTFISEYSLDLAMQGVNTLWGSFEIRNARLAKTMLQQMAGFPLDEHMHLFEEWADKFEKLPIYFMTFHGQQSIKIVMEAVEHATYVYDIAHVIIDNVQFMMGLSEEPKHGDRFWKQDSLINAFRTFATRKNCHVTLVIHPRKERDDEDLTTSSIFGSAKASQEADNVLIIQDKRLTSVRGKKYLQVAKNRYSGDLGVMGLDFDKAGLSYAQKKSKEKKTDQSSRGGDAVLSTTRERNP